MLKSIFDDIRIQFRQGNMLTRLIFINVGLFLFINLFKVFFHFGGSNTGQHTLFQTVLEWLSLNSDFSFMLTHPWTLFTSMFLHLGIWHLLWNMLFLYWFGRIVGDLLGDRRILPIYILGGLAGALGFFIYATISDQNAIAYGASGAVMAMVVAAATTAPDYQLRLLFIGAVKLKFVAGALIVIDFISLGSDYNTGGHFAHLAGALMGGFFVYSLRNGLDLTNHVYGVGDAIGSLFTRKPKKKSKRELVVVHKQAKKQKKTVKGGRPPASSDRQHQIDAILDKIKQKGFESLTEEEKEILYKASKDT